MKVTLTPEILAAFFTTVLSLGISYIPGAQNWYSKKTSAEKSSLMLIGIVAIAVVAFGLSCANIIQAEACTQEGIVRLSQTVFVSLVANQGVYSISNQRHPKLPPIAPTTPDDKIDTPVM